MIVTADSLTQPGDAAGKVLVSGSHGGVVAAHYAAKAKARAVIVNDAGIGLERAGIAGLALLDSIGMAAAAVGHASARVGNGADTLARGVISTTNLGASACGVAIGMSCRDAAVRLSAAAPPVKELASYHEGRYALGPGIWGLDSIGMLQEGDAG